MKTHLFRVQKGMTKCDFSWILSYATTNQDTMKIQKRQVLCEDSQQEVP